MIQENSVLCYVDRVEMENCFITKFLKFQSRDRGDRFGERGDRFERERGENFQPRGPRQSAPKVDDEHDFPSLG